MGLSWPIAEVPEHLSASARRVKHHCFVSQFIFIYFSRTPIRNQSTHRVAARSQILQINRPRLFAPARLDNVLPHSHHHRWRAAGNTDVRIPRDECAVRAPDVVPLGDRAVAAPATANNNQIASGQRVTATRPGRSPSGSHWRRAPAPSVPDSPAYYEH